MINRIHPEFNTDLAFQYHLSILLKQDGFSFLIKSSEADKLLAFQNIVIPAKENTNSGTLWRSNLSEYINALQSNKFLRLPFASVVVSICSERNMLVPERYSNTENLGKFFSIMHQYSETDRIITDLTIENGPTCASLVPEELYAACRILWPDCKISTASSITINGILHLNPQLLKRQIFVQIWSGYIELIIIQGTKLLYANSFICKSTEDVIYYIVFVLEQLGFVPSDEELMLIGDFDQAGEVVKQMQQYFAKVSFAQAFENKFHEFDETNAGSAYRHFTLLNLALCE